MMQKEMKFKIITEGLKDGISSTCKKYNISRTIFYRWLKRYKETGLDGLDEIKKEFIPKNKIKPDVEEKVLALIKTYPSYGPKAIKYLLEEINCFISESAAFNVMQRHKLTNKENRKKFSKAKEPNKTNALLPYSELKSGECWIFWITDYGSFENIGKVYEYTIIDAISKIASTRVYNSISFHHFEDLLTAVAIPVSQTLNFTTHYLCFLQDSKIAKQTQAVFKAKTNTTILDSFYDITIHTLDFYDDINSILELKKAYTQKCLTYIIPLLQEILTFDDLKYKVQHYVRLYNISEKQSYNREFYTPIEYHEYLTHTKPILPLWAYIDRKY